MLILGVSIFIAIGLRFDCRRLRYYANCDDDRSNVVETVSTIIMSLAILIIGAGYLMS